MTANKRDDARRKRLRRLMADGQTHLSVSADDLKWLLDEASRLQQSNDRLRRQNRRLRLRSDAGGEPVGEGDSGDVAEPLP